MTMPDTLREDDLHAYVDGALDLAARADVEAWLKAHPEEAARAAAYAEQRRLLHARFDAILDEAVPPRRYGAALVRNRRPWRAVAAAVALFVAGVAAGYGVTTQRAERQSVETALFRHAVGAHRVYVSEVRHPVEVGADEEAHLVGWLSKRLGQSVKAPNLITAGFRLVGGRLLPDDGAPAAQFMYEDSGGRRVTVYVRGQRSGGDTAFRFAAEEGAAAFYWVDGPLGYAIAGSLPREELLALARLCYEQLES